MMTYEEFKAYILEHVLDYFPEDFQLGNVSIERMTKNNDTILDGLRIVNENSAIAPVIYVNGAFKEYQGGVNIDTVVEQLAELYKESMNPSLGVDLSDLSSYDAMKGNIVCRLVNAESNQQRLENVPYTQMEDLAVTYHIVVSQEHDSMGSIMITNDLLKRFDVPVSTIHEHAMDNMKRLDPPKVQKLSDVIMKMMVPDFANEFGVSEEEAREMVKDMAPKGQPELYVVSNTTGINGANAIVDETVREQLAETLGGNYFILPSSVHECLVLAEQNDMTYTELEAMVQDVNATQVKPDEKLSDHVYHYDAKTKEFTLAEKAMQMKLEKSMEEKTPEQKIDKVVPEKTETHEPPKQKHSGPKH